jgi:hypothetical protein
MKHILTTFIAIFLSTLTTDAQTAYSGRIETGYQHNLFRTVTVDPGPNWKGYNLDEMQNGFNCNIVNGLSFTNKNLFTGIAIGYLNFEGIEGISILGDFEYLPLKNKLAPLFNLKLGYNHIWNQYAGGTATMQTEFGLGLNYRLNEKIGIHLKSGMLKTQQCLLIPITIGLRY